MVKKQGVLMANKILFSYKNATENILFKEGTQNCPVKRGNNEMRKH